MTLALLANVIPPTHPWERTERSIMGKKDKKRNEPVDIADSTSEQQRQKAGNWSSPARYAAELFGTFLLVLGGVGTALFAANFPSADDNQAGVGFLLGVALAFGLTLVAGIAAVGHISGGHFNPAVTLGLLAAAVRTPATCRGTSSRS